MSISLKVTKSAAALKESSGGGFIGRSGVYDVTTRFVSLKQSEKGAVSFDINVLYNGNEQAIYGNTIMNTDGKENEIGMRLLNKLFVIAGLEEGADIETDVETFKVGKDGTPTEFTIIPALSDLDIKIQVKEVYTRYEGEIRRKLEIYNFFDATGATAQELTAYESDKTVKRGEQLEKILAMEATTKYISKANGNEAAPTDDEIADFIKGNSKSTPKPTQAAKPKGSLFAKK